MPEGALFFEACLAVSGPDEVLCVARNVTRRKRAEEDLEESEARHRAVVEQSVEGIFLFDAVTRRILESNVALQQLLGYAPRSSSG